ncbi:MAG: ABC transporter substrate-binding protein [Xenophilus sp.]
MQTSRRSTLTAGLALAGLAFACLPAHAQDVVKIGFSGPLSGGAALYGKNVLEGMQIAMDEINAAGGVEVAGKKVKLEIAALDDKYNPSETAINAQRLVQESKTPAILVPHSGGIYAVQTTNERQKLLLLAYSSTPPITERGNKLTYRIPPEYTGYVAPFIQYAMGKFGKNVALAAGDHDYAKIWAKDFKAAWEKAGGKVVADNPMSYNKSADFYSGVSKVLAAKPDVLFIGGASEPTGLVIKQAREQGFKGGFMIIDQAKPEEVAKVAGGYAAMEGAIGVMPVVDDPVPATQAFVQRYRKTHPDKDPSYEVTLNYTAVHVLAQAMKLAGTATDAAAIRSQLDKAAKSLPVSVNFQGLGGVNAQGGAEYILRTAVIEGGKVHPYPPAR